MSKAMISSLIDEINLLLSRPVGSVTERVSVDIAHPRDQLKRLRSHLEKLTEDSHLNNLDEQYWGLVAHLQEKISSNRQTFHNIITEPKELEILPLTTVKSEASNLFGDKSDLSMETSTIAPFEEHSPFLNDCMIASRQQLMNIKIETVQDFAQRIEGYEELWTLLKGKDVKRIKPRVLRANGNLVLIDKNGNTTKKAEFKDCKVREVTILNGRVFITVAYSGYEPIAQNMVTGSIKRLNIDATKYEKNKFIRLFKEIYPFLILDDINYYKQQKDAPIQKKKLLIEQIQNTLKQDFVYANEFYKSNCKTDISQYEYNDIKQKFVQNWNRNNLGNTPDLEQSLAISSVNSHVQLIARAGSGKTSTLVNRAIFLQRHCGIKSSEILLLAFNRKAAQEIRERLQKNLQNDLPYAMTFHALAYHLVHPDETLIFDEPDGQQTKSRSLQSVIDEYVRNPDYSEQIKSLMIAKFRKVWIRISEGGYDLAPEEMIEYRRSLPQVGIDGYNYKSGGEKIIADFLFEHDIPFKYEKNLAHLGLRGKWYSVDTIIGDMVGL